MEKRRGLKNQKGSRRRYIVIFLMLLFVLLLSVTALADGTGWKRKGKRIYYYQTTETGEKKAVGGVVKIEKKYYYFSKVRRDADRVGFHGGRFPLLQPQGECGIGSGRDATQDLRRSESIITISIKRELSARVLTVLKKNTYYFNTGKKLGVRGRAITSKWENNQGQTVLL